LSVGYIEIRYQVTIHVNQQLLVSNFFTIGANDRGYAHLRFAGASLSQSEKVNAGANTSKCMSTSRCA